MSRRLEVAAKVGRLSEHGGDAGLLLVGAADVVGIRNGEVGALLVGQPALDVPDVCPALDAFPLAERGVAGAVEYQPRNPLRRFECLAPSARVPDWPAEPLFQSAPAGAHREARSPERDDVTEDRSGLLLGDQRPVFDRDPLPCAEPYDSDLTHEPDPRAAQPGRGLALTYIFKRRFACTSRPKSRAVESDREAGDRLPCRRSWVRVPSSALGLPYEMLHDFGDEPPDPLRRGAASAPSPFLASWGRSRLVRTRIRAVMYEIRPR